MGRVYRWIWGRWKIFFLCLPTGFLFLYLGHEHTGQTMPVVRSLTETPSGGNVGGDLFLVYITVITVFLFFFLTYLRSARPASPGLAIP